jgi:hypothetical protein
MKLFPSQLAQLLKFNIENRFPTMVVGPPGVGKTQIVKQGVAKLTAEGKDHDFLIRHPVVDDPVDYKGLPNVQDGKAKFLPFGDLEALINPPKPLVVLLDDLGTANASVQAAAMQLILERRINNHKISDNVIFIAATNRHTDRAGVSGILEPVKSRFYTIVELQVSVKEWIEWAMLEDMPSELIAFVRFRPNFLEDEFVPSKEIKNSPCPRTLAHVGEMMMAGLPKELERPVFEGAAGEAFASEFERFLLVARELPSPEEIFHNPRKAKVPTEISSQYALCGALAHAVEAKTFGAMNAYIERLPEELQVMTIRDVITRKSNLTVTPDFKEWIAKNARLLGATSSN